MSNSKYSNFFKRFWALLVLVTVSLPMPVAAYPGRAPISTDRSGNAYGMTRGGNNMNSPNLYGEPGEPINRRIFGQGDSWSRFLSFGSNSYQDRPSGAIRHSHRKAAYPPDSYLGTGRYLTDRYMGVHSFGESRDQSPRQFEYF